MKHLQIILLTLVVLSTSCDESDTAKVVDEEVGHHVVTVDQVSFDQAWAQLQTDNPYSDMFQLNGLSNDSTTLIIDVAYSGGCEEHTFELIWPEVMTMIYPPRYTVILNHDANDDTCEAYLSTTLYFDLSQYDLGLTPELMDVVDLTIINGSNGEELLKLNN
ncbi:hypothetical protein SAMN04488029_3931 [Reichenbachiella faecimaris]|uniref:Uncharacterized protein n=1 Tax=Reichenbachiella faecimaris TaxID=692418 RepID=A0A1W2GQG2_REIFA|nr:hypothetical protein [Reichenbachiella faecimaris]SMD38893.1 hypothetical protein SAMN04488029_3931 [Reichenbachiella faecimaris]